MPRAKTKQVSQTRCHDCGQPTPGYDIVHLLMESGAQPLCSRCLSAVIAEQEGVAFEHIQFHPIQLEDCEGTLHTFRFATHFFGPGVAVDAFEVFEGRRGGYQFQVIGKPDDDLLELLGRLIAKIRRGLSVKYLEKGDWCWRIANQSVRGTIHTEPHPEHSVPVVEIDGRAISWEYFGQMLATFEGWQFKLEIRDKSEEF